MREPAVSWGAFCAGLAGLLALLLFTLFGAHPLSPKAVQEQLRQKTQAALEAENLSFASVSMRGQTAVLTGAAPNAEQRAAAERAALTAAGPGGVWSGGVARVRNELVLATADGVPVWRAVWRNGRLRIEGAAPDAAAQAALLQRAQALFSGAVEDASVVAGGPGPKGWSAAALESLHHLARLAQGEARFVGDRLFLMGEGDARAVEAARRFPRAVGRAFRVEADVGELGQLTALAGLPAVDLSEPSGPLCGRLLAETSVRQPLAFQAQTAELSTAGMAGFEALARLARRCDAHPLAIRGAGEEGGLVRRRAETLLRLLVAAGVRRERLRIVTGTGDGEAVRLGLDGPVGNDGNVR